MMTGHLAHPIFEKAIVNLKLYLLESIQVVINPSEIGYLWSKI